MTTSPRDAYEVHDYNFEQVASKLPFYDGKYDSVAYIDWELAVDNEFDIYDFSDAQMIKAASNKFTSSALFWWTYVSNKPETWDELKTMMRKHFVTSYYKCTLREKLEHLKQGDRTVREYIHEFKEDQHIQEKENGILEKKEDEAPVMSEESSQGKLNGAKRNEGEYSQVEQLLVESIAKLPLSQVDLLAVPCDKEELCDNASLISMPQLVNEHAIPVVNTNCADFKHVVHIANRVEERELTSSLNTLGYVQFADFHELDNLKEKLFAKSDLPGPSNANFHLFGEYNDRGIYLVHRVYICSDLEPPVHVDKTCKLERNVIANKIISSLFCCDWKKQVVLNGLHEEHHMEKLRMVFREEGEDDVTMATIDTTVVHIKIKPSKFCNPVQPPTTVSTSNGRQICMRAPFWVHEYLMESSRSHLSNGSNFIAKFHPSRPKSQKESAASPIMGLWACNFVWDPGPTRVSARPSVCLFGTPLYRVSIHLFIINSLKDRANNSRECREELRVHHVDSNT
ncbi:OSJNBa0042P21.25 [Oryza sativa (japonica cultivar-group)]